MLSLRAAPCAWRTTMNTVWTRVEDGLPTAEEEVLCFDSRIKRRFVGVYTPALGGIGSAMWCDEECTFVPVTHWALWPGDPA